MKPSLLYTTDFYYQARGRNYYEEDLRITAFLMNYFNVLIVHPQQAISFLNTTDLVVIRNTGPVIYYHEYFQVFKKEALDRNVITFNSLDGKADMQGKHYLVEMTKTGYPVIPTIDHHHDLPVLENPAQLVIKPLQGADSINMKVVASNQLDRFPGKGNIVQPKIDFEYEVSFYFINDDFQYALYAPEKQKRWKLTRYQSTDEDVAFARKFIQWNRMQHSLQRVDACRLPDGRLLLVELEDLNPYLSLDLLEMEQQETFLHNFKNALQLALK